MIRRLWRLCIIIADQFAAMLGAVLTCESCCDRVGPNCHMKYNLYVDPCNRWVGLGLCVGVVGWVKRLAEEK